MKAEIVQVISVYEFASFLTSNVAPTAVPCIQHHFFPIVILYAISDIARGATSGARKLTKPQAAIPHPGSAFNPFKSVLLYMFA